jgi:hypothetical protein
MYMPMAAAIKTPIITMITMAFWTYGVPNSSLRKYRDPDSFLRITKYSRNSMIPHIK